MAASYRYLRQVTRSSLLEYSFRNILSARLTFASEITTCTITDYIKVPCQRARGDQNWLLRNFSHGSVKLVTMGGTPRFEIQEIDPPKREKWKTKKRLKLLRKREKQKRKEANKKDPHHLTVKGNKKKHIFPNVEERIKYRLEKARIKESLLVERLTKYEIPKCQGPVVEPNILTGEERFYLKKMGQKGSNYVPVGRRGIFGGVILNMHMHWKKHETVKVFCKPCKPGQIHEYAQEIARLSGGIPIQIIGDDTIIFYRGKDYVQPKVMSPIDTLSKKKALEKSKYEQSLESVRHFIAVAEKELELYYRHIALYSNSNDHDVTPSVSDLKGTLRNRKISHGSLNDSRFSNFADAECDSSNAATDGEFSCSETEPKDEEC